jgi:hypothetical protein
MRPKTFLKKTYRWLKREPLKKFKEVRYKVWLGLKQISFKDRDEKIKRVERILSQNSNIYFTTDLVRTGFTDQLIGFNLLYKMGRGIGLKYHHTPLSAHRSSDPFMLDPITQAQRNKSGESPRKPQDVFDLLGVNEYLNNKSTNAVNPHEKIVLNLNLTLYGSDGIDSYESLLEEMKVILYSFLKKKKEILLVFQAEPRTYFHFYKYISDQKKYDIDYSECYKKFNSHGDWKSEFIPNSTNILVHIRQGDTGTIKTPWNTFIPVWLETEGRCTQFKNERDIPGHKRIYPEQFYRFLKDLQSKLEIKCSTVVFSDGYKKTFRFIYKCFKKKSISLEEIEKLKKIEPQYNQLQFNKFNNLPNTRTVIGEEVDKLYSLVQSLFDTNIIIAGTQALLTPKFLATYGNRVKMPLLILLYHTEKPSLEIIGFKESAPFLMFVDVENYNISDIANRVSKHLKSIGEFK